MSLKIATWTQHEEQVTEELMQKALDRLGDLRCKYPSKSDWDLWRLALALKMGEAEELKKIIRRAGPRGDMEGNFPD